MIARSTSITVPDAFSTLNTSPVVSDLEDANVDSRIIDIIFRVAENGFPHELRACGGLCRATWREESLWSRLVRVSYGINRRTRLSAAAVGGDTARVGWVLARGADVSVADASGWTALHHAAFLGHTDVVQLLLNHIPPSIPRSPRAVRKLPLLPTGASLLNAVANGLWTPLAWAAHEGHAPTVKALLDAGADPNLPNRDHLPPLHHAVRAKSLPCVNALINARASVFTTAYGLTGLHYASRAGSSEIVDALIAAGALVNCAAQGASGATPLIWAALEGADACIHKLLIAGADVTAVDDAGATALHSAALYGRATSVAILLSAGAQIDARASGGWTPLHFAVKAEDKGCLAVLLEGGASVCAVTDDGFTPLSLARQGGCDETLSTLLKAGARDLFDGRDE